MGGGNQRRIPSWRHAIGSSQRLKIAIGPGSPKAERGIPLVAQSDPGFACRDQIARHLNKIMNWSTVKKERVKIIPFFVKGSMCVGWWSRGKKWAQLHAPVIFDNKNLKPAMGGHPLYSPIIAFC